MLNGTFLILLLKPWLLSGVCIWCVTLQTNVVHSDGTQPYRLKCAVCRLYSQFWAHSLAALHSIILVKLAYRLLNVFINTVACLKMKSFFKIIVMLTVSSESHFFSPSILFINGEFIRKTYQFSTSIEVHVLFLINSNIYFLIVLWVSVWQCDSYYRPMWTWML